MHDSRRTAAQRGYGSRWQKARYTFLCEHPLCVMCEAEGRAEPATVVDHIQPHKGDQRLFWDSTNWQSLCAQHHSGHKQMLEKSGDARPLFDANGRVIWK